MVLTQHAELLRVSGATAVNGVALLWEEAVQQMCVATDDGNLFSVTR
jgi:hypothetical protein